MLFEPFGQQLALSRVRFQLDGAGYLIQIFQIEYPAELGFHFPKRVHETVANPKSPDCTAVTSAAAIYASWFLT